MVKKLVEAGEGNVIIVNRQFLPESYERVSALAEEVGDDLAEALVLNTRALEHIRNANELRDELGLDELVIRLRYRNGIGEEMIVLDFNSTD